MKNLKQESELYLINLEESNGLQYYKKIRI
ncbi:hypothetical protein CLPUN_41110 [Clostridium puniceum]|uniref:Uncharacterized protein n=1 Tax=Clostridium puniceum TaxID=29367 RepID=A0A1S8T8L8_9CLOT|nr:hypothetical protein CLPUN_41110 [Clostridium puniceum]